MRVPPKPDDVVDRDREWRLLTDFVADPAPAMRLGIVSGRRRQGKSFLLQALTEAVGGLYITAVREEGRVTALQRFSQAVASHAGLPADALHLADWRDVFGSALDVAARQPTSPSSSWTNCPTCCSTRQRYPESSSTSTTSVSVARATARG